MKLAVLTLLGCLALLMFGMKTMSEGLQKLTGNTLRTMLGTMTKHRVMGVATGTAVTATIQSSTATTVLTVSFVNAGLLTLKQAISIIMGANIGTTISGWIMVLGFKFDMLYLVYPCFVLGIILSYTKKNSTKSLSEFLFGLAFMLFAITTLRTTGASMHLGEIPAVQNFVSACGNWGFASTLLFLLIGGVLTMCVQSSAAVMAITLILCSSGALEIYQGIALVMGENIGTTVTSNVVALSASTQARRAALAHLLFNTFGVVWVLCVFHPFVNLVCTIVGFDPSFKPSTPEEIKAAQEGVTFAVAAFHTMFNVVNVLILIWFIKPMETVICKIIKDKAEDDEFRLKFISSGILSTAELSLFEARKEIILFGQRCKKMFNMIPDLLVTTQEDEFNKLFSRIEKYESISDSMEVEIAKYLNQVSEGRLSSESKVTIQSMLREISEMESIGDAVYNMARAINHKFRSKNDFTEEQCAHINHMVELCNTALDHMLDVEEGRPGADYNRSRNIENEINNYRKSLKERNVADINDKKYDYQMSVHYMDVINACEHLGDYVINVVEAHVNKKLST
ncbi:MAG: Na/Pi cotransporter family protein [Fibrobacter sp.]|nr:Na/Pi cotransporter family protein [Fibrobacter sp.]